MAPKGKSGDKGKSKGADADKASGKAKGAQNINVRHILCEKQSKKEEALAKLKAGSKFDEVRLPRNFKPVIAEMTEQGCKGVF